MTPDSGSGNTARSVSQAIWSTTPLPCRQRGTFAHRKRSYRTRAARTKNPNTPRSWIPAGPDFTSAGQEHLIGERKSITKADIATKIYYGPMINA